MLNLKGHWTFVIHRNTIEKLDCENGYYLIKCSKEAEEDMCRKLFGKDYITGGKNNVKFSAIILVDKRGGENEREGD